MRFSKRVAASAIVAVLVSAQAWGETMPGSEGPAEPPPASFTGRQYVDSKGCVFVRAGYDGTVSWVPRVRRDRTPICGYKPTFAEAPLPEPEPTPEVGVVVAAPAPADEVAVKTDPARVAAAPPPKPAPKTAPKTVRKSPPKPAPVVAAAPRSGIPEGYKAAWSDGRLNSLRGPRTAAGDAQMAEIFVPGKVPMVQRKPAKAAVAAPARGGGHVIATKNAKPEAAPARAYVQVGSFADPANAAATAARLTAAGLPVAMGKVSQGGKTLQVVLAGPFRSAAEVLGGLTLARRAGFSDAFVRR